MSKKHNPALIQEKDFENFDLGAHFPLLDPAMKDDFEAMMSELADGGISPLDLEQLRVPSGSGVGSWSIIDEDGEEIAVPVIHGIILGVSHARRLFTKAVGAGPGSNIPSCVSNDGIVGQGTPGGKCENCPHNEFGTKLQSDGTIGGGKACTEYTNLIILRPHNFLPSFLQLPPMSTKHGVPGLFPHYRVTVMAAKARPLSAAVTEFSLAQDTNASGTKFQVVKMRPAHIFGAEQRKLTKVFAEEFKGLVDSMRSLPPPIRDEEVVE